MELMGFPKASETIQFISMFDRFTQDPLEAFFSMQRQRGGGSDNPTALQFTYNTSSLRIQRSLAPSACSNVRGANMTEKRLDDTLLPQGLEYQGVVSVCNVFV